MSNFIEICPLCLAQHCRFFYREGDREFYKCDVCELIFLKPASRLTASDEKSRYATHTNHPNDPKYRQFLSRLAKPLIQKLHKPSSGLDYGCGPGPTLSVMLEEQGFDMRTYDPFFAPDKEALTIRYDFICCSETVEHFYHPDREFQLLNRLLKENAWLGVMTSMVELDESFYDWWYHRDPTHVCFYRKETMKWIADKYQWKVEFPDRGISLFHRTV